MQSMVSKREAANILAVDLSTVNRMIKSGTLTPAQTHRAGDTVVFYTLKRADVERLKRSREKAAAS